ncbi:thioredoxin family protein [Halovibrio sp. HP20-50]|jgi:thioredoxin 1|uniref:thioredoxin family protein n=1 Tax=Halovibrio sp. HP20-59 TaxID=3080275 RepID=UPI00294B0908|nr:thioredoxin family protein [Halovibrio sp. HP20-59]MEA2118786.1 thioredoxin family protein [Halovibrio sp. HP20-59]
MTIKVEVFAVPDCPNCAKPQAKLREAVADFSPDKILWREVDLLEEMDYAIDLGVMGASALAIDGKLVFASLPKPKALRRELLKRLEGQPASARTH